MTTPREKLEHRNERHGALPDNLSAPAQRALAGAGISTLDDLTRFSRKEILQLHGVGRKTISPLEDALAERGLSFANDS